MTNRLLVGMVVLALVSAGSVGLTMGQGVENRTNAMEDSGTTMTDTSSDARNFQGTECNYTGLFDRVSDSVVTVNVSNGTPFRSGGSGWVYRVDDSGAYIVTNWHVVYNWTEYDVQFGETRWREAELVGTSEWTDLAVLRIENPPDSAEPLPVSNETPERGQPVAAFGTPVLSSFEETITRGIVSGVDRALTLAGDDGYNRTYANLIQTDAAINPGNSGGPLVNCQGELVGVNFAGFGELSAGLNFAISARTVETVVPSLIENGTYRSSFLGIRAVTVDETVAESNNLSVNRGVVVAGVLPGGPADGVLQEAPAIEKNTGVPYDGDVILAIDGRRIVDRDDLLSYLLLETRPNETVNVTILRDGQNQTVEVTLGERPSFPAVPPEQTQTTTETTESESENETVVADG